MGSPSTAIRCSQPPFCRSFLTPSLRPFVRRQASCLAPGSVRLAFVLHVAAFRRGAPGASQHSLQDPPFPTFALPML